MLYNIKWKEKLEIDNTWKTSSLFIKLKNVLKEPELKQAIDSNSFQLAYKYVAEKLGKHNINMFTSILLMSNIDFLSNMTIIPTECFSYIPIEEIEIPGNIEFIDNSAFYTCPLKKIILNKGLETIYQGAFLMCEHLEYVEYKGTKEEWGKLNIRTWNYNITPVKCSDGFYHGMEF